MADPLDIAAGIPLKVITKGRDVSDFIKQLFSGAAHTAAIPGKAAQGYYGTEPAIPGQWSEEDQERSNIAADKQVKDAGLFSLNMAGARSPFIKSGEAGIFGGRLSPAADQEALKRAEQLQAAGATRDAIWTSTGWFQGADKKWRFEIPDNAATMRPDVASTAPSRLDIAQRIYKDKGYDTAYGPFAHPKTGPQTSSSLALADLEIAGNPRPQLGEHIAHPELDRAYPDVMKIETERNANLGGKTLASYSPGEPEMIQYRDMTKPGSTVSNLLHEAQHAVQGREGFAQGGNTTGLRPGTPQWGLYKEILQNIRNGAKIDRVTYSKMASYPEGELAPLKEWVNYRNAAKKIPPEIDRMAQETAVSQGYNRLAGEVESRNVQTRRTMTPEERKAKPPWETQDVPDASQYVTFNKNAGAAAEPQFAREPLDPRLYHPISSVKLTRPLEEAAAGHQMTPRGVPDQPIIDFASLEGKHLLPSPGDLSRNDVTVQAIGGRKLRTPETAYGGYRYGSATPSGSAIAPDEIWRSAPNVIGDMQNVTRAAQEAGHDVVMATTAMSPQSIDFSHHVYNPAARLLRQGGGYDKKLAKDFDAKMRAPESKAVDKYGKLKDKGVPDWPGINEPDLRQYLAEQASGKVASKMAGRLDSKAAREAGAPNIAEIRHAFTAPELLDVPAGSAGHNFALIAPGAPSQAGRPGYHATRNYGEGLLGTQIGGIGRTVPPEVMFKELADAYQAEWTRRGLPQRYFRLPDLLTRGMSGLPKTQLVTPQVVDRVSQWLENSPPLPGRR